MTTASYVIRQISKIHFPKTIFSRVTGWLLMEPNQSGAWYPNMEISAEIAIVSGSVHLVTPVRPLAATPAYGEPGVMVMLPCGIGILVKPAMRPEPVLPVINRQHL